jgi:hypothetical protein
VRHRPANGLRRREWMVDTCSLDQGRELVKDEHYAVGSSNTATFRHGLYRRSEWPLNLTGCALWIPPTRAAAEATTDGDWRRVLSLSRLAIRPEAPTNAASFLLGGTTRLILATQKWDVLVTYADEWQGHTGSIYLAAGWTYVGKTKPERTYVLNGAMVARKAGPTTRTHSEMLAMGAEYVGSFAKHKFVKDLRADLKAAA